MAPSNLIEMPPSGRQRGHPKRGSQFMAKMDSAVAAVMSQRTLEDAARALKISLSTLKRWKQEPVFQEAYLRARQAAMEENTALIQQYSEAITAVLLNAAGDSQASASVRVRAARAILDTAQRGMDLELLAQRVNVLERAQQATVMAPAEPHPPEPVAARQAGPGHGSQLPGKLETVAAAVVMHRKLEDAARAAGISVSTLQRWKKLPEFQAAWMAARQAVMFEASARLQRHLAAATRALVQILTSRDGPPGAKVQACQCLLEHGFRSVEGDLERRIALLERGKAAQKDREQQEAATAA